MPSIVVAHTVLRYPTAHQRAVLEAVVRRRRRGRRDDRDAARDRLRRGLRRRPGKVVGDPARRRRHRRADRRSDPTRSTGELLTWGLLGPGKGIEWAIDALALLDDLRPRPRYLVAGDTHPKVRRREGEAYREMLRPASWRAGVARVSVTFDAGYRDLDARSPS